MLTYYNMFIYLLTCSCYLTVWFTTCYSLLSNQFVFKLQVSTLRLIFAWELSTNPHAPGALVGVSGSLMC